MVTRRLASVLLAGVVTIVAHAPIGAQLLPVDSIRPFISRGAYVFEARLQKTGVVADSLLPASAETAVAQVRVVFACPREVGNFAGEVVTLFEPLPHAPVGSRSWYFATGWAVGDHVAVRVLRRVDGIGDSLPRQFFDSLRAAVRLSYEDALQAAAMASDMIVIGTFGTTRNVMMDLVPPRTEHPERWARVDVTVDSIRTRVRKSVDGKTKSVAAWVAPADSVRHTGILLPYELAYDVMGRAQYAVGSRRLLFVRHIADRPNLQNLDSSAGGFIPSADGIRSITDATLLGDTQAMPTFSLPPVKECVQKVR